MGIETAGYASYVAIAAALAGTAVSVRQSEIAADNAVEQGKIAAADAGYAQDAAQAQADQIREAARRQRAAAKAALSASGVSVNEGTPIKIDQEIARGGEYDALQAILSGDRGASTSMKEATAYGKYASSTRSAGYAQGAATLIQSGASIGKSSGWRSQGPGFSGTQAPAPVVDRSIRINP